MAENIQKAFINPPIAMRQEAALTPQKAYRWVQSPDPAPAMGTTIEPDWSLEVQSDGTVEPVLPTFSATPRWCLIGRCPFLSYGPRSENRAAIPQRGRMMPVTRIC